MTTSPFTTDVTVIGLGMIGVPIARTLLKAGKTVTVWNRTPGRAASLTDLGAREAPSPTDAIRDSPVTLLCLTNHEAALDLLHTVDGDLAGSTVVNLATSTPEQAQEAATRYTQAGAEYLAGAIMAVPETIGSPDGLLLYSGSSGGFEAHGDALRLLGTSAFLGVEPSTAALYDTALLGPTYALYAGYFQAVALLQTQGVGPTRYTELLVPWLRAILGLLPVFADEVERGDHRNAVSSLQLNRDAVANVMAVSERRGVPVPGLHDFRERLDRQVAAGNGGSGLSGVVKAYTPPATRASARLPASRGGR